MVAALSYTIIRKGLKEMKRRHTAEEELRRHHDQLEVLVQERTAELQDALSKVKTLSGFLPICASCKNVRDDKGYWQQIEAYIKDHSDAVFSHSICPSCAAKLYPDIFPEAGQ